VIGRCVWDAGRLPRFLAKASLFTVPVIGRILVGAGQIPVYRGTVDAEEALRGAVAALQRGEMVIIYPEGTVTRDPDFWPMQPKTGIARLAMLAPDVPLIPIAQWGPQEFLDFYARRFRPWPRKSVSVSVGEPLDLPQRSAGASPGPAELHAMSEQIMNQVVQLLAGLRGQSAPEALYARPAGIDSRARDAIRRGSRRRW
jgi:1-acyl-sn-glycerol-3-phosphate acyltransferase